jgi:hypothetical protein
MKTIIALLVFIITVGYTPVNLSSEVVVIVYLGSNPVNQATVQLIQNGNIIHEGITGISGKAVFHNVTDGTYNIKAFKQGLGSGILYNQTVCCGYSVFSVTLTDIEKISH